MAANVTVAKLFPSACCVAQKARKCIQEASDRDCIGYIPDGNLCLWIFKNFKEVITAQW